jgi:hypothetical protein
MTSTFSTKDSTSNILSLLCSRLEHLVIDFLVGKEKILSNDQTHHGMLGWKRQQKV